MIPVTHRDTDYLFTGTHKGASGTLTLNDPGRDFRSSGAIVGLAIHNDTDSSTGLITAVTEDTVTCTLSGGSINTWSVGDTYKIYKTAVYDSKISTHWTDKRYGRKAMRKSDLVNGLFPDDIDVDENTENIFGPGQPERFRG
jgi:hypothetical protein